MNKFMRRLKSIMVKQTRLNGIDYEVIPPIVPPENETIEQRTIRHEIDKSRVNAELEKMSPGSTYILVGVGRWIKNARNVLQRIIKHDESNLLNSCSDSPRSKEVRKVKPLKKGKEIIKKIARKGVKTPINEMQIPKVVKVPDLIALRDEMNQKYNDLT